MVDVAASGTPPRASQPSSFVTCMSPLIGCVELPANASRTALSVSLTRPESTAGSIGSSGLSFTDCQFDPTATTRWPPCATHWRIGCDAAVTRFIMVKSLVSTTSTSAAPRPYHRVGKPSIGRTERTVNGVVEAL